MSRHALLSLSGLSLAAACSPQTQPGNGAIGETPPVAGASGAEEAAETSNHASEAPDGDRAAETRTDDPRPIPGSGRETTRTSVFMARAKTPLAVLGRFLPGRLEVAGGCLTVTLAGGGRAATAVLPPDARLVYRDGKPVAVRYAARTIPIGEDTRIPGGGSVSAANLAAALPAGCPSELFPVGG